MNEHLVIDRPEQELTGTSPSSTSIKTVLFHVHHDDGLEQRLQVALSVARACQAHLHLLHVTPIEAYSVIDAFGTFVSGEIVEALQQDADKLRAKLQAQLAKEDVSWDYEEFTGELMPHLIQCASLADLVIVGRERPDPEFARPAISLLGDLLQQIRTPLLVIGDETDGFDPLGPAVIAWNGSYEAANIMRVEARIDCAPANCRGGRRRNFPVDAGAGVSVAAWDPRRPGRLATVGGLICRSDGRLCAVKPRRLSCNGRLQP